MIQQFDQSEFTAEFDIDRFQAGEPAFFTHESDGFDPFRFHSLHKDAIVDRSDSICGSTNRMTWHWYKMRPAAVDHAGGDAFTIPPFPFISEAYRKQLQAVKLIDGINADVAEIFSIKKEQINEFFAKPIEPFNISTIIDNGFSEAREGKKAIGPIVDVPMDVVIALRKDWSC